MILCLGQFVVLSRTHVGDTTRLNTLTLYFRVGLFNTRVDSSTSRLGGIMRTTCSLSSGVLFCLGDLFPTLRRLHPNRRLVLLFNTVQAPVIRFRGQAAGGTSFNLSGRIVFFVIEPDTKKEVQIAEMSIEVSAHMKLRLSSSMVRPRVVLEKIKLVSPDAGLKLALLN